MQTNPSGLPQGVRIVFALMAAWVVLTVDASNHAAAFSQPAENYRQIIASRGRIPDTVRLDQLTSLYLKDRQQAVTVAAIERQPARWVSRAAEVAAVRRRAPDALAAVKSIDEARLPAALKLEWRFRCTSSLRKRTSLDSRSNTSNRGLQPPRVCRAGRHRCGMRQPPTTNPPSNGSGACR